MASHPRALPSARRFVRWSLASCGLGASGLWGCNAIFDIDEGVPIERTNGGLYGAASSGGAGGGSNVASGVGLPAGSAGGPLTGTGGAAPPENEPMPPLPGLVPGSPLMLVQGVVPDGSNDFGLSGAAGTYASRLGALIEPDCSVAPCFGDQTGRLCISGSTEAVPLIAGSAEFDYANYWGRPSLCI